MKIIFNLAEIFTKVGYGVDEGCVKFSHKTDYTCPCGSQNEEITITVSRDDLTLLKRSAGICLLVLAATKAGIVLFA